MPVDPAGPGCASGRGVFAFSDIARYLKIRETPKWPARIMDPVALAFPASACSLTSSAISGCAGCNDRWPGTGSSPSVQRFPSTPGPTSIRSRSTTDGLEGFVDLEVGTDGGVDLAAPPAAQTVAGRSTGFRRATLSRTGSCRGASTPVGTRPSRASWRQSSGPTPIALPGDRHVTFRGMARHHQDDMSIRQLRRRTMTLAGQSRFDIRDFGMEPPRFLMLKVDPQVTWRSTSSQEGVPTAMHELGSVHLDRRRRRAPGR